MSQRYKIRAFECGSQDGAVNEGTIVAPLDRSFTIYSRSVHEAESRLKEELVEGNLVTGRVYQICPPFGSSESIRALSASLDGSVRLVYLDPATGVYSEQRRIRHHDKRINPQREIEREFQTA